MFSQFAKRAIGAFERRYGYDASYMRAVDASVLRALVDGDRAALGAGERLGFDLARATVAREDASDIREEILRRYGMNELTSLAYAIVAAGAFPAFKYALGYGHACSRMQLSA